MAMKLTSTSFKDGDYLGPDHMLSAEYGFGCGGVGFYLNFNTLAKASIMGLSKR
jgi:hypothetical protein